MCRAAHVGGDVALKRARHRVAIAKVDGDDRDRPQRLPRGLERFVDDFEARANKLDGIVPEETITVVRALLDAAKQTSPDDVVVQAVIVPDRPKYSDLYPTLRQVVLALPREIGIA